ncbi:MAG: 6-pyruvoyl-tetrahydropterin synthase-related protein, partial [Acidobacteriota bacterium]
LARAHLDQASLLYHSMSRTSDIMVLRDEASPVHDVLFGIRAVVAPAAMAPPKHWRRRGVHGRFAVYEASPEGYFGLVDVGARYTGPPATTHDPSSAWLAGPLPAHGVVAALESGGPALPGFARWEPFPAVPAELAGYRGEILRESKEDEVYRARVRLARECHVLLKITFDPGLRATLDGQPVAILRVTPGFAAVPVPAGEHEVAVRYAPGPLRSLLLGLGIGLFACCALVLRRPWLVRSEERMATRLGERTRRLATPRCLAAALLALLALLALRPLFRGQLISGHDATEYPPRLVELARAVSDGHLPPLWAADLGNGHGQPLFEFAPPLLYAAALPFDRLGLRLADSLQLALALLHVIGAAAMYRLGRRWKASRRAALAGAAAWLFAPYLSLDLVVRSAFAEAAALALAPLALLAVLRVCDRPDAAGVALGGAAVALVVLGHNAVALLLVPSLALLVLVRTLAGERRVQALAAGGLTLAAGLGLSAFFWLPALVEKGFVKTSLLREGFLAWSRHALAPSQLLWSPWGHGFSGPGTGDQMSFALGPLHLLLAIAGVVVLLRDRERVRRAEGLAFAALAVGGAWLATTLSAPLWARVETLQYLAYPWRALFLPGLFLPLLAVPLFDRLPRKAMIGAAAILVLLNLPHTEPRGYLTFDDEYYTPGRIAASGINTTTREEYEPRWVTERPPFTEKRLVGVDAPVEILSQKLRTARQEVLVRAADATQVEAATFFYPGWRVTVDGHAEEITIVPIRGTMSFALPAGEHRVVLELHPTPLRRAARVLSAATLLVLLGGVLATRRGRVGSAGIV